MLEVLSRRVPEGVALRNESRVRKESARGVAISQRHAARTDNSAKWGVCPMWGGRGEPLASRHLLLHPRHRLEESVEGGVGSEF